MKKIIAAAAIIGASVGAGVATAPVAGACVLPQFNPFCAIQKVLSPPPPPCNNIGCRNDKL